jgi:hypothetical protein
MAMAVRTFDLTEHRSTRVDTVATPPSRRLLRRTRQRYAVLGVAALAIPFFGALAVLGVAH